MDDWFPVYFFFYESTDNDKLIFVFSQDLYLRVRYGYGSYFTDKSGGLKFREKGEGYQLCSTTMIGWKFYNSKKEISNTGLGFKIYFGVHPHGQFKNISVCSWLGVSWLFYIYMILT